MSKVSSDAGTLAKKTVFPTMVTSDHFPMGVQGMGYIYSPEEVMPGGGRENAKIPIMSVPPSVLMSTQSSYYTGVGEDRELQ
jgi:hypothetical protein